MTSRDTIDSCLISYDMAIEVSHTVDDNTSVQCTKKSLEDTEEFKCTVCDPRVMNRTEKPRKDYKCNECNYEALQRKNSQIYY